jgi:hypothetical protein
MKYTHSRAWRQLGLDEVVCYFEQRSHGFREGGRMFGWTETSVNAEGEIEGMSQSPKECSQVVGYQCLFDAFVYHLRL